jgi:hypothetical protein
MKRNRALRIVKFAVFAVVFVALFGFVVMSLWNWLTPTLFGWHPITFWQGVGLLILSKILFGGFRGHGGHWRHRMIERWERMTPEEREKINQTMWAHCGSFKESAKEPKP